MMNGYGDTFPAPKDGRGGGTEMPLKKSPTNKARQENIRREIDAGKSPKVAVAIAYSVQRKAKGNKR